jgi:hypothetical protein
MQHMVFTMHLRQMAADTIRTLIDSKYHILHIQ